MSAALLEQLKLARAELLSAEKRLAVIEGIAQQGLNSAEPPELPQGEKGLQQPAAFYDYIRGDKGELFPTMTAAQLEGIEADLEWGAGRLPLSWMAYCLATDYHETNKTMQPVVEAYWLSEDWRKRNLRYYPWYGRGKVQLTWEENYRRATKELNAILGLEGEIDLIAHPEQALNLEVAAACLVIGSMEGWYTGKKLRDYLPAAATREHYRNARRVINGTDKADLIAGYAMEFAKGLKLGDWR